MNFTQFPQDVQDFFENKTEEETLDIQVKMAKRLLAELQKHTLTDVTDLRLLDILAVCGLSLTIGNTASNAFFREIRNA